MIASILLITDKGEENMGTVSYGDCRSVVRIDRNSLNRTMHDYTCDTTYSMERKEISLLCVRVVTRDDVCSTAYEYEKTQSDVCIDGKKPFLHYDGKCYDTDENEF